MTEARKTQVKLPVSAYIMAVISCVFVSSGLILVVGVGLSMQGSWLNTAPPGTGLVINIIAVALGVLSGWQTLRQARTKALARQACEDEEFVDEDETEEEELDLVE